MTGKFRGSAHQQCNLKFRIKPENLKIPVIFHNLRGYDSHFIMQQIGEIANKHGYTNKKGEKQDLNINAIPNNMEKYMAFMLGNHLTFIDSFQFMSSSLDKLASNLPKDDLIYTSKAFKGKRLDLLSQIGAYPCDYMDSFEKFNEKELPTKDQFYSILNDQHITDDEYNHAKEVWNTFMIRTLGDYHDLYRISDVLLLTDVFENFRKTCMQYYKLDPCHYFTSTSWCCREISTFKRSTNLREQCSLYALSKLKCSKCLWYFKYLLLLSGDINLHPGPVKCPCLVCSRSVRKISFITFIFFVSILSLVRTLFLILRDLKLMNVILVFIIVL